MADGFKTGGRQKGTPNRATTAAREAIARFVDGNSDKLQEWLDQIAEQEGPKAAFNCFLGLVEYHVPKLARSEIAGDPDAPLQVGVTLEVVGVAPKG